MASARVIPLFRAVCREIKMAAVISAAVRNLPSPGCAIVSSTVMSMSLNGTFLAN